MARFLIIIFLFLLTANDDISAEKEVDLNLVFCAYRCDNTDLFDNEVTALVKRLFKTRPFDEIKDNIKFYSVTADEGRSLGIFYNEDSHLPPLKVSLHLLREISKEASPFKLIIIDYKGAVSCSELSSVDKTSVIIIGRDRYKDAESFEKGFLHEIGHSLGLRDEGIDTEASLCPPGFPNCARDKGEAEAWWGDLVGKDSRVHYIYGACGNINYIRPTISSLMNDIDKSIDYGPVNERFLRLILRCHPTRCYPTNIK